MSRVPVLLAAAGCVCACSSKASRSDGTVPPPSGSGGAISAGGGGGARASGAGGDSDAAGGGEGQGGRTVDAPGGGDGAGGTVAPASEGNSVLERNKHPSRDGLYLQPTLTRTMAAKFVQDPAFNATFSNKMHASPLYVEDGPSKKGVFVVGTTGNDVIALDETSGVAVWTHNIGPVATATGVGCGNLNPRGIVGTPIIDLGTRTIYAVGAMGPGATTRYEAHALSIDDGNERPGWPAIIDGKISSGGLSFDPHPHNQRAALSLVGGILYVPFGGHDGDCGSYHGWVVAIDTRNPTSIAAWATKGAGGAVWASGGMASDDSGVFATTGNGYGAGAMNLDSEAIVRVTGMAAVNRAGNADIFYPTEWKALDAGDDDLGATSPVLLNVAGATPSRYVVAAAKNGHMYFVNASMMGGMGGQLAELTVASAGHSLRTALTSYATAAGVHVALTVDKNAVCPGAAADRVLMSVLVSPGAPIKPTTAWCLPIGGLEDTACGRTSAPMVTTTDGTSDTIVWIMSGATLVGVDGDSGAMIYSGGNCGPPHHWTAPIAVKGRIVVGVDGRLCAWSAH
ncbi:MAG TPA: hypothetical protein VNO55_13595 [Polyangia bacterium]|nr:hypothetical protein [Polyangia bacterium]